MLALKTLTGNYAFIWEIILTEPKAPPLSLNTLTFMLQRYNNLAAAAELKIGYDCNELIGAKISAPIVHKVNEMRDHELQAKVKGASFARYKPELETY